MRFLASLAVLLGAGVAAAACRTGEPGEDPQTPANAPIPRIERRDPEPSAGPSLFGKDAG